MFKRKREPPDDHQPNRYVESNFGGFLGVYRRSHMIPWEELHYRAALKGYAIQLAAADLSGIPVLLGDEDLWPDHRHQDATNDFWPPQQWGY
jgi:hypothetical protein